MKKQFKKYKERKKKQNTIGIEATFHLNIYLFNSLPIHCLLSLFNNLPTNISNHLILNKIETLWICVSVYSRLDVQVTQLVCSKWLHITDQYMHRFQNKGHINRMQTSILIHCISSLGVNIGLCSCIHMI